MQYSCVGTFTHTIDKKNRVFIPSKIREVLGDNFYITRKPKGYLTIYSEEGWSQYVEKIQNLPESVAAPLQDFLIGGAQRCTTDSSGRIVLENRLVEHAKLTKNVVFVGHGNQVRVWSEENWMVRESEIDLQTLNAMMENFNL